MNDFVECEYCDRPRPIDGSACANCGAPAPRVRCIIDVHTGTVIPLTPTMARRRREARLRIQWRIEARKARVLAMR